MLSKCANVRMCKCANGRISLLNFNNIRLFAHSPRICTLIKHLHINQAFAHLHILTFAHLHILTFTKHLHIY